MSFATILGVTTLPINLITQATTVTLGQNKQVIPSNLGYNNGFLSILPEGSHQSQTVVDNLRVPPLILQEDYNVSVRFAYENCGYNDSLGYYTIAADNSIQNVQMLFPYAKSVSDGGPLTPMVTTISLGTLKQGTQLGFFMVSNGYNYNNFSNPLSKNYINPTSGQYVFTQATTPGNNPNQVTSAKITDSSAPHLYYYPPSGSF